MKLIITSSFLAVFLFLSQFTYSQRQEIVVYRVVPPTYETTPGTATFLGPLANSQRTYQLLIHESLLVPLLGKELQAFSMRIPTSATSNWPAADVTYTNYDVYLSGSVEPANRSLTFAQNIVGVQKQVRSGQLIIPANSYTFGNSPNEWGPEIMFDTLYLYSGGHLLVEIRHLGFTGTSRSTDALSTSTTGYGTEFSACWTGSYVGTSGSQGNFTIIRLKGDDPVPVELISFTASSAINNVVLNWITATEINNLGFNIERRTENSTFETIGFVSGAGSTTEQRNYSFIDENLASGNYYYRLKQVDFDGSFEYSNQVEVEVIAPSVYSLEQNYPNPFNPSTNINFNIAEAGMVKLSVYNLLGQEVVLLVNEFKEAGMHSIVLDASSLTSGVYFYKLESGQFSQTRKMILNK
jgi:hypothetical protein